MLRISDIGTNNPQCTREEAEALPFPAIPDDLLQALDRAFPLALPDPDDSERDIWMKVGERRLVEYLLHRKKQELDEYVHQAEHP